MKTFALWVVVMALAYFVMDRGLNELAGCHSEAECAEVTASARVQSNTTLTTK